MIATDAAKSADRLAFRREQSAHCRPHTAPTNNERDSEIGKQKMVIVRPKQHVLEVALAPELKLACPSCGRFPPKYLTGLPGKVTGSGKDESMPWSIPQSRLNDWPNFPGGDGPLTLALDRPLSLKTFGEHLRLFVDVGRIRHRQLFHVTHKLNAANVHTFVGPQATSRLKQPPSAKSVGELSD
jgi:hypothetical protein